MRTNLSCCLGLMDNGQHKSTNRLLILVPPERSHGIMRSLEISACCCRREGQNSLRPYSQRRPKQMNLSLRLSHFYDGQNETKLMHKYSRPCNTCATYTTAWHSGKVPHALAKDHGNKGINNTKLIIAHSADGATTCTYFQAAKPRETLWYSTASNVQGLLQDTPHGLAKTAHKGPDLCEHINCVRIDALN